MKRFFLLVAMFVGVVSAQAQLTTPDLAGISTNLNTVVGAAVTGMNWSLAAAIIIAGILAGLAALGAVVARIRSRTPR